MKLRLIEQACGCSTVRGGVAEGDLIFVLVSASGTVVVESACHLETWHLQVVCLCHGAPP